MNKDTIVGIVGAVILVVAMIGVFKYEGSQAQASLGSKSFDVTWATGEMAGPTASGSTALGASSDATVTVDHANLTQATFKLDWTAQNGKDTLKITVTPPAGSGLNATSAESDTGSVSVSFNLSAPPAATTAFGNSEADAAAKLAPQHTRTFGQGEWTVKVEFTQATGVQTPIPGAPPVLQDQQVAWTLSSTLEHYEATLKQR